MFAINWKNTAENLGIVIIAILFGVFIGYKISIISTERLIERLIPTIEKAIDKESISNTINNAIDLKIDKIKKSDSLHIDINQKPTNIQKPKNAIIKNQDSIIPEKKRSWFNKIFGKKNKGKN